MTDSLTDLARTVSRSVVHESDGQAVRAGFSKVEISEAAIGSELFGYPTRVGVAQSIHDPLYARSLVLECGDRRIALCTLDLISVTARIVAVAGELVAKEIGIPSDGVFVSASHTHSSPFPDDPTSWPEGLETKIVQSITEAFERLTPAQIGAGWGMVHGQTLNRRHLEDPVDPAVLVIRVDDLTGAPLGVYFGFACHPVVLGPDSLAVSGDWVAKCAQSLEAALGGNAIALYAPGAHGDVNPLTEGVRARLTEASAVNVWIDGATLVNGITYYGSDAPSAGEFNIGDRRGGTFHEMDRLGATVAEEVQRVHRGIKPVGVTGLWSRRLVIRERLDLTDDNAALWTLEDLRRFDPDDAIAVMVIAIDGPGIVLVGEPGEIFGETGVRLRRNLRARGIQNPFVVGYTNGFRGYFPPSGAFAEGGYEIAFARALGVPETLQDEIQAAVLQALDERAASSDVERNRRGLSNPA
jgi:hypothetical protein